MTWLQALIVKILMLAATVGVLYWAVLPDDAAPPEPMVASVESPEGETEQVEAPAAAEPVRTLTAKNSTKTAAPARRQVAFPLDLNTAKADELMELPGIGETLARRLVEYRQNHGGFRNVEELRNVRGIGEKRMERLRPLVMTAAAP